MHTDTIKEHDSKESRTSEDAAAKRSSLEASHLSDQELSAITTLEREVRFLKSMPLGFHVMDAMRLRRHVRPAESIVPAHQSSEYASPAIGLACALSASSQNAVPDADLISITITGVPFSSDVPFTAAGLRSGGHLAFQLSNFLSI